ncbi:MAG TPA: reverse transcriptase domain-containing protein, partial [Oculatellaceae cyanobacterium]
KGSLYNVTIEWENGEKTDEPLSIFATDNPVPCAIYARDNNLLHLTGWKSFKPIAKRQRNLFREANLAKLCSFSTAPKFKYGFEVPRNYSHAMQLDKHNGNTKWEEATKLELQLMDSYKVFTDKGLNASPPQGYKIIRVHFIYDVKHDGRHCARLVADGHLTGLPTESIYSGVVSLRGLCLFLFVAELNGLLAWATDIGSAYLEAYTDEKVCIKAGPEFGDHQGHLLIIDSALYSLRSSGARWHDRLADVLRNEGINSCLAEPDIWMCRNGELYEYIAVYVDDLAFAMIDPSNFVHTLKNKYGFKIKDAGPLEFHLGADFYCDKEGVLCMAPQKYIGRLIQSYEQMFGKKPSLKVYSPFDKGDHPELDNSELLDKTRIEQYQSILGSLQWAISLGRFDIATAVMSMSSFCAAPRKGHLECLQCICGYLAKMKHATIWFHTHEPDYSDLPSKEYDWTATYGEVTELLPQNAPEPLGKPVILTHYVDANLFHDALTGWSVTGILHMANATPIDWYSKKQSTVETATY